MRFEVVAVTHGPRCSIFNRETTQKWPRTWPQPPYSPPQASHDWQVRWGCESAADSAGCVREV